MNTQSVFELLVLRSEWEDIVRGYKFVGKDGTIDNLVSFLENGHKGNRFRQGFDRATEIAKIITESFENETFNLSGVSGEEV